MTAATLDPIEARRETLLNAFRIVTRSGYESMSSKGRLWSCKMPREWIEFDHALQAWAVEMTDYVYEGDELDELTGEVFEAIETTMVEWHLKYEAGIAARTAGPWKEQEPEAIPA
jgi:hypothetical protein